MKVMKGISEDNQDEEKGVNEMNRRELKDGRE